MDAEQRVLAIGEQLHCAQAPSFQREHRSASNHHFKIGRAETRRGRMEGSIHDSQRYRDNAAACLLAAQGAREPHFISRWLRRAVVMAQLAGACW